MLETSLQFRGTVLDLPADEIKDSAWSYAENVFFRDLATQRIAGYTTYYDPAAGEFPVFCYPVQRKAAALWLIVVHTATGAKVLRWDGGTAVEVDNGVYAGVDALSADWQGTDLNGIIILNNGVTAPHYWDETVAGPNGAGELKPLPDWPANTTCRSIRAFKYHLFAFNLTAAAVENPYEYMWSSAAEPGAIPQSWTAAPQNDAGNSQFATPQGFLVDAVPLRDSMIVFKDFSAHLIQYTGGVFVFSSRELYISAGMMNIRCAVELNGRAVVATQDDVIMTDGNTLESICTHQVRRAIFNNLNSDAFRYTQVVKRHLYDEIWVCIPQGNEPYATLAAIYNTRTRRWGFQDLPNVSCLNYGLIVDDNPPDTWDERTWEWDTDPYRWDHQWSSKTADEVVMCRPYMDPYTPATEGKVYVNNRGWTKDGESIRAEVKREGVLFNEDATMVKAVSEVWPNIVGLGGDTIMIQVGGAMDEDGPTTWAAPVPFVLGETSKIDCRVHGRFLAFRFYSDGGAPWRMYDFRVRYKVVGRF